MGCEGGGMNKFQGPDALPCARVVSRGIIAQSSGITEPVGQPTPHETADIELLIFVSPLPDQQILSNQS